jgi:D-3-phosphoglycerate dehydrogenase
VVGIVGFGRIGREVALRLAPFKCRRLVHDPVVDAHTIVAAGCEPVEFAQLLDASNIVTLHCPSTPQTRRMLNAKTIARLKHGTIIVNLARGDLIETSALLKALQSGHLGGAALDVCDPEPIPAESPLRQMKNVIVAAHVASTSVKAVRTLRETAANIAVLALAGKPLPNIVNGVRQ